MKRLELAKMSRYKIARDSLSTLSPVLREMFCKLLIPISNNSVKPRIEF